MDIAVIGTGNVGKALGSSLAQAGHRVTFAARDAGKTKQVADEVGASAATTPAEAARGADAIVLAVPYGELEATAAEVRDASAGKVIVDATNPLKADYSGLANIGQPSDAERLAALLPDTHVAKAFNTLFAAVQADPTTHGSTLDALYATDDDEAASTVTELATSIGFRPVRVGPLEAARELESLAWLNIRLQMISGGDWRTAPVLVGAPETTTTA
jgi:8-hydroxy-5-deazaflavin:NADPH oxidoreductase